MLDKIKLERAGNVVVMTPWYDKLFSLFKYTRREQDYALNTVKFVTETLIDVKEGHAIFPAGLTTKVINKLKAMGVSYEYFDYRDLARLKPVPDFTYISPLRQGQDTILKAVIQEDGGVIVAATGVGKSHLIKEICKIYPTLKIIITTPRASVVRTLSDRIEAELPPGAVGVIGGNRDDGPDRRITIVTNKSLLKADLRGCDLFLFDEVHGVGHNQVSEHLSYVTSARMFGFTATPKGRSDGAELVIEALFGPELVNIGYAKSVENKLVTPIEVHMYDVTGDIGYDPQSPVAKKRHNYWRFKGRNILISNIAKSFPDEEQVLIMVETLEHAVYLQKLLPNFKVVHATQLKKDPGFKWNTNLENVKLSSKEVIQLQRDFEEGTLKKVISTGTWKEGVDFTHLTALIRADGAPGAIPSSQIPGRLSRLAQGKNKAVLIDFIDHQSDWALGRSRMRLITYRNNKWSIIMK